ncbi:hypothetical protein [Candidatus Regiella endosymbiont of Tuberolachnus salignus]|uniref:hypothetical protein n=1 Tax=Candidatus Regiella endosymbiont of Tuberolachnus salignus TaxID=3077956 RepID=UPI0030CEAA78
MPAQPTVEINQPEAISSDSHSPIYYTGKTKSDLHHFKHSANFPKFKQEYEQAIQSIIDFYKQHAPNQGQNKIISEWLGNKTTVEDRLKEFKTSLFSESSDDRLRSLYQAKKSIEAIAQSLQEERSISTATKMDEIRELAGKIMLCGSGVHSHIIGAKLSLTAPSGELSDNFSTYKDTIAHAVITEFISHHLLDTSGGVHIFNKFLNHFSQALNFTPIYDEYSDLAFISTVALEWCQNALQEALAPYSLTDKLATDHWNNLHNIIGDAAEWEQINNILAGVKSSYKPINVYALIEEAPDSPGKYRLRQDKTWLQVEIAKQLSLLPSQIAWIDWTPIAVEGRRLQRIGDLFWQEIDGELSPPTIEDLVKHLTQVAYEQLIDGIARAKEQDAPLLSEIDPQYLQVTNAKDLALFFSKLGAERSIEYVKVNLLWFNRLVFNPLITTFLTLTPERLATIPTHLLNKANATQLSQFFAKLGAERGIEYVKTNLLWFNELKFNPLITTLLTLPPEQLATLSTDLLCHLSNEELISFFLKLGDKKLIRYAQDHPDWSAKLTLSLQALIKVLSTMPDSEVANVDTSFLHWINLYSVVMRS